MYKWYFYHFVISPLVSNFQKSSIAAPSTQWKQMKNFAQKLYMLKIHFKCKISTHIEPTKAYFALENSLNAVELLGKKINSQYMFFFKTFRNIQKCTFWDIFPHPLFSSFYYVTDKKGSFPVKPEVVIPPIIILMKFIYSITKLKSIH